MSIFAIGFSNHFVTESGGDFSVTNSNSNFGQTSLRSKGYREDAFNVDDIGYISNIVPPRKIDTTDINLEYTSIDVSRTVGVGSTSRLYLYNQNNPDTRPESKIQGYRVGAKSDDRLFVCGVVVKRKIGDYSTGFMADSSSIKEVIDGL